MNRAQQYRQILRNLYVSLFEILAGDGGLHAPLEHISHAWTYLDQRRKIKVAKTATALAACKEVY